MKSLKALLGLLLVIAGFYAAWKLVPPYFNNYQFQDEVSNAVLLNSYSNKTEDEIRNLVAAKAAEYDIPLSAEQVTVERRGSELAISAEYTVHVDLPVWPLDLKFRAASKNRRI